jgi:hypothetical protein
MEKTTRFVGLDVHKASIAVAVAVADAFGDPEEHGQIANDPSAVHKLMQRLGGPDIHLVVAYEAGPTGYALHRQLTAMGIACVVVAPSLVPRKPGDRVKTDRRDAAKLARLLRSGDLTAVSGARRGPRGTARPGPRPRRREGGSPARQAPARARSSSGAASTRRPACGPGAGPTRPGSAG